MMVCSCLQFSINLLNQNNTYDNKDDRYEMGANIAFVQLFPAEFWPDECKDDAQEKSQDQLARIRYDGSEGAVCKTECVSKDEIADDINDAGAVNNRDGFKWFSLENSLNIFAP